MSLYLESSKIISRVNYGGIRAAVYSDKSIKSKPEQLYALCVETLKHQEILSEVIEKSQLLKLEKKVIPPVSGARSSSQVLIFLLPRSLFSFSRSFFAHIPGRFKLLIGFV